MKGQITLPLLAGLLLLVSGCSTRNQGAAISGVSPVRRQSPTPADVSSLENSCALLNTHDLAGIFPTHTETILPKPQIGHVGHPAFSSKAAAGTETSCVYYSFHLPGSHSEIVLQVNYWLDRPDPVSAAAWTQAWAAAGALSARPLPGIGDGAFHTNGRLSFRKRELYVTVLAIETDWNLNTSASRDKQLAVEKKIAEDMLNRLQ